MDTDRITMLTRNNQTMHAELLNIRKQNEALEGHLAALKDKQVEYVDTLAGVDRIWQQLTKDMAYVSQRIRGFPPRPGSTGDLQDAQTGLQNADPFLKRLISSEHVDADIVQKRLEEMADDATEVEKLLAPRSAGTFQAFASLIELHDKELASYRAVMEKVAQGQDAEVKQEIQKLHDETLRLRQEVDAQKAVSRTAEAQLQQLTDMLQKDEKTIQDLNNELEDKKEALNAANRKLQTIKSSSDVLGLASQGSLPAPLVRKNSTSPAPKADLEASNSLRAIERELKIERDRADSLAKQLRDAQAKMQDETCVLQSATYQLLQRQLHAQTAEMEKARKAVEVLQRECDGYSHSVQGLMQQAEDARHQRRMVHLTEERIRELELQVANARAAQEAAELNLQKEKEKYGNAQTVQELSSMVDVLEKEVQTSRGNVSKRQGLLAEVEAARKDTRSALTALEGKEAELQQLSEKMGRQEADLTALQANETKLKTAADDMRVFVEVLQSFCDDPRDLAEVRASEASLKTQLTTLQKQLQGHELQAAVDKVKGSEAQAQAQLSTMQQENTSLQLEVADLRRQCVDMQHQVATLTADIDAYTNEMEVIGTAYEDMQGKNSRLLQQLAEKDERHNQLLTERIQAQHSASSLAEQKATAESARQLAVQQVAILQERVTTLEARLQEVMHELGQARERGTVLSQQAEQLMAELRDRDAALKLKETQLATVQSAAEQRKRSLDEEAERLQREKSRRQRIEEEHKELQSRLENMGSDPGQAVDAQLEGLRLMLRCKVCHVRTKDTVITKCWHTFCGECIKRNLDARNRKCPACGHPFGAHDVKQIYL